MFKIVSCVRPNSLNSIKTILKRNFGVTTRFLKEDTEHDRPIKFSESPASKYRAKTTRTGYYEPRLWYEPYVILTSLSVFLLYFLYLREENDIDLELNRSLYSRIEGLEEFQLRQSLAYNEEHGKNTEDIIKRLKEIETEKKQNEEDMDESDS